MRPVFLVFTTSDLGVFAYWCLIKVALNAKGWKTEHSLKCTITFTVCFRNVPPIGLGMIPQLVTFESPVHTNAILFCAQILHIVPKASFNVFAA
jgi:hypothetical protein